MSETESSRIHRAERLVALRRHALENAINELVDALAPKLARFRSGAYPWDCETSEAFLRQTYGLSYGDARAVIRQADAISEQKQHTTKEAAWNPSI